MTLRCEKCEKLIKTLNGVIEDIENKIADKYTIREIVNVISECNQIELQQKNKGKVYK